MTTKQLDVIILAGGLRLSPLRSELKVHELCLPITQSKSLLAAWLEVINELKQCRMVVIAVKDNMNLMKNDLTELPWNVGQFHQVENYLEAAGLIAAIRSGIDVGSVQRPLSKTSVTVERATSSDANNEIGAGVAKDAS